jgi:16S rRNA C967 or C1407 C5-methylase (RsmB/RsmF family)
MNKRRSEKPSRGGPRYPSNPGNSGFRARDTDREIDAEPEKNQRVDQVIEGFEQLWTKLFQEPVHLDSSLAKQPPRLKSILARIVPTILLRPASQAEALGVGVRPGEPWSLSSDGRAQWRPARLMAEKIYSGMIGGLAASQGVRDDFPPHIVEELEASFGAETTADLIRTLSQEAPLSLRVSRKVSPEELLRALKAEKQISVRAEVSDISPLGLRLAGYAPVLNTGHYERGEFEIQDEGSQFMALFALWPEIFGPFLQSSPGSVAAARGTWPRALPQDPPAWNVVDTCAGAGGKSLAMADALQGRGRVYAYDISEKKLQALRRRAARGGYNNIQAVHVEDGKESDSISKFKRRAQVVLVDAPCTGWGVLRRNSDIKWRQPLDVLERMPQIQQRLLNTYSELVAPGGRLVFGVCTFRKAETVDQVQAFLAAHPDFIAGPGGYLGPGPCDGFFMQSLERKG